MAVAGGTKLPTVQLVLQPPTVLVPPRGVGATRQSAPPQRLLIVSHVAHAHGDDE